MPAALVLLLISAAAARNVNIQTLGEELATGAGSSVQRNAPNDEPTSLLAICGAIKPTNPTVPAKATAIPAKAVLSRRSKKRFR